ncbi:ABC transporter permease subunit [Actinoplanes sp. NPDC048796]|uniref:ABC transporter permease subunit n=1 Tax=Actinoplanes sp. NPDC048796 TaxID=3155640 RepID=UPI0033F72171
MIWLTWRQFRVQAWVAAAFALAIAAALAVTGPHLFDLYQSSGLADCTTDCADLAENFSVQAGTTLNATLYAVGTGALLLMPALVGVFWGAPLVARELETGTHRLVWNQTVSRRRWILTKLIGIGGAAAVTAAVISAVVTWWTAPLDDANVGPLGQELFSARGVVPVGYATLGFMAGVLIGMLLRRSVAAMAVTLLAIVLVQVAVPYFVREHLTTPVTSSTAFDPAKIESLGIGSDNTIKVKMALPVEEAWELSNVTAGPDGEEYTGPVDPAKCGRDAGGPRACERYLGTLNLTQKASYIPVDRFWLLQWRELGLLLAVSALLAATAIWWINRKVA